MKTIFLATFFICFTLLVNAQSIKTNALGFPGFNQPQNLQQSNPFNATIPTIGNGASSPRRRSHQAIGGALASPPACELITVILT